MEGHRIAKVKIEKTDSLEPKPAKTESAKQGGD
jgi:hypothetical protein